MLIIRRPDLTPRSHVSGKWSAFWLVLCFAVSGCLIPVAAHLPHWIEFELVLLAWWLVWIAALSWLLVNAHVVKHDAQADEFGAGSGCSTAILPDAVMDGCLLGSGCAEPLGWIAIALLVVLGAVFVVEFLIPGLAFLLYLVVRAMLARVTNDHRNCEGKPPLAFFWGLIWATAYTAPIALVVWGVHVLSRHPLH